MAFNNRPRAVAGRQPTTTNSVDMNDSQSSSAGGELSEGELELHLWQRAFFLNDGSCVRHAVDSYRLRMAQLHYCCAKE